MNFLNLPKKDRALAKVEQILTLITKNAMSTRELSEALSMTPQNVRRYLHWLRFSRKKRVYIEYHEFGGHGVPIPYYRAGSKVDDDAHAFLVGYYAARERPKLPAVPNTWLSALGI